MPVDTQDTREKAESTEKTAEQYADDLYKLLTGQDYAFNKLADICQDITNNKAQEVQSKLNIKKGNESDPNKKNQYATLIEIIDDFIKFNNETVPATQQAATEIRVGVENHNESIIDETCLTFKLYNGLDLNTIKDTIIQKVNRRNDPEFAKLFLNFKNLKDTTKQEANMKTIQQYLNDNVQPNPELKIDGKFGNKTYNALKNLTALQTTVKTGAENGEGSPETTEPTPIKIKETDIPNTLRLYGRRNHPEITKEELITTCNKETIPNAAKEKIKTCLTTSDISGLQNYLNELLNPTTEITSGPYIDRREFAAELTRKYPYIPTDPDSNGRDRNDQIQADGFLGPQTLIAISCIKEKQPKPDESGDTPSDTGEQQPEGNESLTEDQQKEKITTQIRQGLGENFNENNINFSDLNNKKITITFKEQVNEGEEKENKIIFNWEAGTLQFEGCDKTLEIGDTMKISNIEEELTATKENGTDQKYCTFEFAASLGALLSKTKATKCQGLYYCTYEENDKKIKLHSLSYNEDTKGITSSDSDLFDADGETDALTNLNTRYFDQNTEEIKDTLTKEETQKAIAKFMTLNIDKSQNHWDEAKTEIQKDDFYRNEDFD